MNASRPISRSLRFASLLLLLSCNGFATGAHAQADPSAFEFYFNLYPEWKVQRFATPSTLGTDVGNMGTLRNDTRVLARDASPKATTEDHEWSNSYIGFRGEFRAGPVTFGYDLQGLVDFQGSFSRNFRTRDAFVYAEHEAAGRLSVGQMDTMYKEVGDPVRMLGVSSGNIVSTARVVSGVGWRAAGATTFNNRVNHMVMWVSPRWAGFNLGLSHSADPVVTATHLKPTLSAAGVQWRSGPWYAALATEVHRNWLPLSLALDTPLPAATSIRNSPTTASSRDQGWRVSGAWTEGPWRVGSDLARLRYAEDDSAPLVGKFRQYTNLTGQVSAEYKWNSRLRISANHARASAGSCRLSGGVVCSTNGLGGHQTSLGTMYALNDIASVFALAVRTVNNPAALYGSSAQGAETNAYAIGVRLYLK